MKIKSIPRVTAAIALLFLCSTIRADENALREQVSVFVDELAAVPGVGVDRTAAVAAIQTLSPEQLQKIQAAASALPNWQTLPNVVAEVDEARRTHDQQVAARFLAAGGAEGAALVSDEENLEYFRADFLFLLDQLDRFSPMMRPEFGARVALLRKTVRSMPAQALPGLRKAYEERAADLIIGGSGNSQRAARSDAWRPVTNGCGGCGAADLACWISKAGCLVDEVDKLVGQLEDLQDDVANFFTSFFANTATAATQLAQLPSKIVSSFNDVVFQINAFVNDQFRAVTSALPTTVAGAIAYVGVDWNHVNWSQIAGSIPTIAPPCPQQAVDVAAEACDRGADALTQLVYELSPDDGLSLAFKLGVAMAHYPLAYLCQCKDIQDAIAFADEEQAHRELTGAHLDLRLSTRATEASVNALRTSVRSLDSDVAKVEAKLDTIGATTSRIDANAARIESTVARIESNVDRTEATSNETEQKIDVLIDGNTEQQDVVADFTTLMKRLSIEENLLHSRPDAMSLFQLPSAFGGDLETVALIAADTIRMNLAAAQNIFGAERELQRGDALRRAGDFVKAYEAYRSAYTEAIK